MNYNSESSDKFRTIFNLSPVAAIISDLKTGCYSDVNEQYCKLTGYSSDELIGKSAREIGLWSSSTPREDYIRLIQTKKNIKEVPLQIKTKQNEIKDILWSAEIIKFDDNEYILSMIHDITEQKKIEELYKWSGLTLQKQKKIFNILNNIISNANKAEDMLSLYKIITGDILRLLDFDAGGIYLIDPEIEKARLVYSENAPDDFIKKVKVLKITRPIYSDIFIRGEALFNDHYETLSPVALSTYGVCSLASVPLVSKKKVIGALNFLSTRRPIISEDEKFLLISIGNEAGTIINRIRAEEESKSAALNLESLFSSIDEMVFILDLKGNIINANDAVCRRLNYTKEELEKMHIISLHAPEDIEKAKTILKAMIEGIVDFCPLDLYSKNGERIASETKVSFGLWDNKKVLFGVTRDITDRKKSIELIRKSEEKYRNIFENIQDVYFEADMEGKVVEVSPSIEVLSKGIFNRDNFIGKNINEFYLDLEDREVMLTELKNKGFVSDYAVNLKNIDGTIITCSISSKLLFGENGIPKMIVGSLRDITERKKSEDELVIAKERAEESDKLKSAFLANISHEIRTPMNSILGFAELLSDPEVSPEEQGKYLKVIEQSGRRMLNIINDIIDISKIESGQVTLKPEEILLNQMIKDLLIFFIPETKSRNISIKHSCGLPDEESIIIADRTKLVQVMTNLLKNAFKFIKSGQIEFGYERKNNFIEFFVKDNGPGIEFEMINHIFDRFRQGNISYTKSQEGAGLGLAISKSYVELMGGKIWVESEVGSGSTFYFNIPYKK